MESKKINTRSALMESNNNQHQEFNQVEAEKNKKNTIQRCPHDRENPYVMCAKKTIQDKCLTWEATGLLIYLLSLPKDWVIRKDDICKRKKNGRDSSRTAFNELISKSYIFDVQRFDKNLKNGTVYYVYETPYENRKEEMKLLLFFIHEKEMKLVLKYEEKMKLVIKHEEEMKLAIKHEEKNRLVLKHQGEMESPLRDAGNPRAEKPMLLNKDIISNKEIYSKEYRKKVEGVSDPKEKKSKEFEKDVAVAPSPPSFKYKINLTDEQKNKLIKRLGKEKTEYYIDALLLHLKSIGKPLKYKCHYSTILAWNNRDESKHELYENKKQTIPKEEKELMERIYNKYLNEYRPGCIGTVQEKCLELESGFFMFPNYKTRATLMKLLELLFAKEYVTKDGFQNCASKELKEAERMLKCDNIINEIYKNIRR